MRFDDSLTTVLAADTASGFGAQAQWRQLVDLLGRHRVDDVDATVTRLRSMRDQVPASVRAASGRALAWGEPPAALVAFFAEDELAIAAPVLRLATLRSADWLALLPRLTPAQRAVLRHRRDLPADVVRGLESFGATDFVIAQDEAEPVAVEAEPTVAAPPSARPVVPDAPLGPTPFVALGEVARAIPVVAEALRQNADPAPRFEIADLVARIDAFQRERPAVSAPSSPEPPATSPDRFRFETDTGGTIRWVDHPARGALVGLRIAATLRPGASFRDVALRLAGGSTAAGDWRLAGEPLYARATGRFEGFAGIARRQPAAAKGTSASDSLRQLVHELRTPTNAIAGFAELIGSQLLGPVPPHYGERAQLIQRQAGELIAAIDDLDTAARIEGGALELRPGALDLVAVVARAAAELRPLATARGATLLIEGEGAAPVACDDRALDRLVTRLLTVALSAARPDERLRVQLATKTRNVRLSITRPRALTERPEQALLSIDGEPEGEGAPLLGTGFTLRLAANLATELGGRLAIEPDRLTLRLPIAFDAKMEQAAAR